MRVLCLMTGLWVLGAGCVFGQEETACVTAAFVADTDSGVNVRSGAGRNHKILKAIPRDPDGTTVIIDGSKGDWLKISLATNSKGSIVYSGTGWILASLLSVRTRSAGDDLVEYYGSADTKTKAVGAGRIRSGLEVILQGCSGTWVKVLIPARGTEGRLGWLPHTAYCGSLINDWEDCPEVYQ